MRRLTLLLSLTYAYKKINLSSYESVNLPRLADIESQKNEFYKNPPLAPPKAENKPVPKITSKSTALLDCNFHDDPCYWRQQVDFDNGFLTWNHIQNPPSLTIHSNGRGPFHSSKLVTPNLNFTEKYCFNFEFQSSVRLSLVEESTDKQASPGRVIFDSKSTETQKKGVGFATIRTGPIQLYFMLPDILENTPDVRLTNFESVKYADSECEIKENQDKDSLPTGYNGTVTLNLSGSTKSCEWVSYPAEFSKTPDIVIQAANRVAHNIRASVDYIGFSGFRVCAYRSLFEAKDKIIIDWRASSQPIKCFGKGEFKCVSGECISRRYLCDGAADCLSLDDEDADLCAAAMGTLAFATFASTIMTTYLITYRKYVKDIRTFFLSPVERDEERLESIHMRELSREISQAQQSQNSLNVPVQ